jgi:hypothetical protein
MPDMQAVSTLGFEVIKFDYDRGAGGTRYGFVNVKHTPTGLVIYRCPLLYADGAWRVALPSHAITDHRGDLARRPDGSICFGRDVGFFPKEAAQQWSAEIVAQLRRICPGVFDQCGLVPSAGEQTGHDG